MRWSCCTPCSAAPTSKRPELTFDELCHLKWLLGGLLTLLSLGDMLYMDIESGMAFMIALYCTTQLGGGIPAILFNMPGEGGAVATTLDGYPMTRKGQAQQALVCCFWASAFGGLVSTLATMAL